MLSRPILPLALLLAAFAPLRADIRLASGPSDNRAVRVTGFVLNPGEAGFNVEFTDGEKAVPLTPVRLLSVTLTARDKATTVGLDDKPLYLKAYDSAERTKLVACSANALRWDPPAGVPLGSTQTYRFEATTIPMDAPLWFAFESEQPAGSPLGLAGLGLSSTFVPPGYAMLGKDYTPFSTVPPTIELVLQSPSGGSPWPLRIGVSAVALLALGATGVVVAKRRRAPAPSIPLPPPPGQEA